MKRKRQDDDIDSSDSSKSHRKKSKKSSKEKKKKEKKEKKEKKRKEKKEKKEKSSKEKKTMKKGTDELTNEEILKQKRLAPMSKEEWEKQQSVVRRYTTSSSNL